MKNVSFNEKRSAVCCRITVISADLLRVDESLSPVFISFQHRGPRQIQRSGYRQILFVTVRDTCNM